MWPRIGMLSTHGHAWLQLWFLVSMATSTSSEPYFLILSHPTAARVHLLFARCIQEHMSQGAIKAHSLFIPTIYLVLIHSTFPGVLSIGSANYKVGIVCGMGTCLWFPLSKRNQRHTKTETIEVWHVVLYAFALSWCSIKVEPTVLSHPVQFINFR